MVDPYRGNRTASRRDAPHQRRPRYSRPWSFRAQFFLFALAVLFSTNGLCEAPSRVELCRQIVIPSEEQTQSDHRLMYAYMSVNAAYEYERLQKMDTSSREAEASFKLFSADYNESRTKEDFSEKVRQRLMAENFTMNESDARASYKRGLTDSQVAAWQGCVHRVTGAGSLLLSARSVTSTGFTLLVARVFPQTRGHGDISITVRGGTIDGKHEVRDRYEGEGAKAYEISRSKGVNTVVVNGNFLSGFTDTVLVDYTPPPKAAKPYRHRYEGRALIQGGYFGFSDKEKMLVSSEPNGGPSENFKIEVDVPRAGTYQLSAMWTSAVRTEVHVFTAPLQHGTCTDPNLNVDDAKLHYFPPVTGGWGRESLPHFPDVLGNVLLPRGKTEIIFTTRPCGGGMGGGRLPSTAWVELMEFVGR